MILSHIVPSSVEPQFTLCWGLQPVVGRYQDLPVRSKYLCSAQFQRTMAMLSDRVSKCHILQNIARIATYQIRKKTAWIIKNNKLNLIWAILKHLSDKCYILFTHSTEAKIQMVFRICAFTNMNDQLICAMPATFRNSGSGLLALTIWCSGWS